MRVCSFAKQCRITNTTEHEVFLHFLQQVKLILNKIMNKRIVRIDTRDMKTAMYYL